MNYQMQGMLRQLSEEIKKAEESGDEIAKKRSELFLHYLLIKTHTLRAVISEPTFKFNALTFFHLSMKVWYLNQNSGAVVNISLV